MKFSEYVVLEKTGAFMDPLGFLKPYTALQDLLFKQFTVLSNHPSYHGLLSCIYLELLRKGITPGKKGFSKEFRNLEILWGLLNAIAKESVLNVTKYKLLAEQGEQSLDSIPRTHSIFYRLNYGTLGHYSSPSIFWGILEKGGTKLTNLGTQLGNAYDSRDGVSLAKWFERWSSNEKLPLDNSELIKSSGLFNLKAEPSLNEQAIWGQIFESYCNRYPRIRCLWENPFTLDELAQLQKDETTYRGFFPALLERYPTLSREIELIRLFESLSSLVQYFFEREYLACQYATDFNKPFGAVEENLGNSLKSLAVSYVTSQGFQDAKSLFAKLSGASGPRDLPGIIVDHHVTHQKSKRVSPFIEEGRLLVKDKANRKSFAALSEKLAESGSAEAQLALINYNYRRDWHFARASLYSAYAGGSL
jgi:hypothetical protein